MLNSEVGAPDGRGWAEPDSQRPKGAPGELQCPQGSAPSSMHFRLAWDSGRTLVLCAGLGGEDWREGAVLI